MNKIEDLKENMRVKVKSERIIMIARVVKNSDGDLVLRISENEFYPLSYLDNKDFTIL